MGGKRKACRCAEGTDDDRGEASVKSVSAACRSQRGAHESARREGLQAVRPPQAEAQALHFQRLVDEQQLQQLFLQQAKEELSTQAPRARGEEAPQPQPQGRKAPPPRTPPWTPSQSRQA